MPLAPASTQHQRSPSGFSFLGSVVRGQFGLNSRELHLERIPLEKRPKKAKYRHLLRLKATDLNSGHGTGHAEVFGCVSGQDVVGS